MNNDKFHVKVLDLIIHILEERNRGRSIYKIPKKDLLPFTKNEIIAAQSYVLSRFPESKDTEPVPRSHFPHRILHMAESLVFSAEAHSFILRVMRLGLLNPIIMEKALEHLMLNNMAQDFSVEMLKKSIAKTLFSPKNAPIGSRHAINFGFTRSTDRIN